MMDSRQQILLLISKVLSEYQWLIDSYILDYFLKDHWNMIPSKWSECLNAADTWDIPWMLGSSKNGAKRVFPLSFLCLRQFSMFVRSIRSKTCTIERMPLFANLNRNDNDSPRPVFSQTPRTTIDYVLTRGIKLKKRHEIERLSRFISCVMQTFNNDLDIIDFGSGQGHLSRILTLCHGFRVFCIEADGENINGATVNDAKVSKALKKYDSIKVPSHGMPTKLNRFLTKEYGIDKLFGDEITRKHLLLGLHACGSLSNLVLEEFVNNPNASCLVLACCCYFKTELSRFPMSEFTKKNSDLILSTGARELACHAIEKFLNDFSNKEIDSLNVHGYRACLEVLIDKYAPERRRQPVKNVKKMANMAFKDYVRKAIDGLNMEIPEQAINSLDHYVAQADRVLMFYSLRVMMAPIVELFILLDYEQYLREQTQIRQTYLVPLFEPAISPRNFILMAHK